MLGPPELRQATYRHRPTSACTHRTERTIGLRERQRDGDDELANALEHVIGRRASPLTPLPVELADLGEALSEQDGTANYLDLQAGNVWLHTMTDFGVADDLEIDFSDDTRWLFVLGEGSHAAYRDLQRSLAPSMTKTWRHNSPSRSRVVAPSGGSAACLNATPPSSHAGTASMPTRGSDTRAAGSPTTATKPDPAATTTSHNRSRAGNLCASGPR